MTDMQSIQQEGVSSTRNVSVAPKSRDFFDDFSTPAFSSRSRLDDDLFKPKSSSSSSAAASKANDTFSSEWEVIDRKTPTKEFGNDNTSSSSSTSTKPTTSYSSATNDGDAQKRFTNAKAISSDQFFNKEADVCLRRRRSLEQTKSILFF